MVENVSQDKNGKMINASMSDKKPHKTLRM